jgi:hypothetical protein
MAEPTYNPDVASPASANKRVLPVLYLDIVGTLLVEKGSELKPADYTQVFLDQIRGKFQVRLLSSLEEHQANFVTRKLAIDAEYIPYRRALGKASAIDFKDNFYWIDDDPTPSDLLRLADERCSDRLIPVNRREGVTEATLKKLLNTCEQHAAPRATES